MVTTDSYCEEKQAIIYHMTCLQLLTFSHLQILSTRHPRTQENGYVSLPPYSFSKPVQRPLCTADSFSPIDSSESLASHGPTESLVLHHRDFQSGPRKSAALLAAEPSDQKTTPEAAFCNLYTEVVPHQDSDFPDTPEPAGDSNYAEIDVGSHQNSVCLDKLRTSRGDNYTEIDVVLSQEYVCLDTSQTSQDAIYTKGDASHQPSVSLDTTKASQGGARYHFMKNSTNPRLDIDEAMEHIYNEIDDSDQTLSESEAGRDFSYPRSLPWLDPGSYGDSVRKEDEVWKRRRHLGTEHTPFSDQQASCYNEGDEGSFRVYGTIEVVSHDPRPSLLRPADVSLAEMERDSSKGTDLTSISLDRNLPVPDQDIPIPDQDTAVPNQALVVPDLGLPVPDQDLPVPGKDKPVLDQAVPAPDQTPSVPNQALPVPDQDQSIPVKDLTVPDLEKPVPYQPLPVPVRALPVPDQNQLIPDPNQPELDQALPASDQAPPVPNQTLPEQDQDLPLPDQNLPLPDQELPLPDKRLPLPNQNRPELDQALPEQYQDQSIPDEDLPVPDQAIPVPIQGQAVPPPATVYLPPALG